MFPAPQFGLLCPVTGGRAIPHSHEPGPRALPPSIITSPERAPRPRPA